MSDGIKITVSADTAAAAQKIEQFFGGMAKSIGSLAGLGPLMAGIAPAIASAFAVDKIAEFTRSIAAATERAIAHEDAMGKMAHTTGLTIETIDAFNEAALETNTPVEKLSLAMLMFNARIGEAYRMGGDLAKIFRDMKIPIEDARGALLPAQQIFESFLAKWREMPSIAEKSALATEMFSREGKSLVPLFDKLASGMAGLQARAGGHGMGVTEEQAEAARQFQVSIRELNASLEEMWKEFADQILPTLQRFVTFLQTNVLNMANVKRSAEALALAFRALVAEVAVGAAEMRAFGAVVAGGFAFAIGEAMDGVRTFLQVLNAFASAIPNLRSEILSLAAPIAHVGAALYKLASRDYRGAASEAGAALGGVVKSAAGAGGAIAAAMIQADTAVAGFAGRSANRLAAVWDAVVGEIKRSAADLFSTLHFGPGAAPSAGQNELGATPGAPASVQESEEGKKLIEEIDKLYVKSTRGRISLLNQEEKELKQKCDDEIHDVTLREAEKTKVTQMYARQRADIEAKEAEERRAIAMGYLKQEEDAVNKNPDLTTGQKQSQLLAIYQQQLNVLNEQANAEQKIADNPANNPEEKLQAAKELESLTGQMNDKLRESQQLAAQNNPFEMMRQSLVKLMNDWGTASRQMASVVTGTLGTAVNSLASNITKGLEGTEKWRKVWLSIGVAIETEVIQGIIKMGIQLVLAQILSATVGKMLAAASVATLIPIAAAESAIWAGPATLATIATEGQAAASAPLEMTAALAAGHAAALAGGAAAGGLIDGPGTGTSDSILMRLSKGEFVFSAAAVDKIGADNLASLHQNILDGLARPVTSGRDAGAQLPGLSGAGTGTTVEGHKVNIAFHPTENQAKQWLSTSEGENHIVGIVTRKKTQIGIGT